jgi:hypothetical protein
MNETFHIIGETRLNKNEIDILCNIAGGFFESNETYSIIDIIHRSELFAYAAEDAVHHLILEGLLEWAYVGETVRVPAQACDWLDMYSDTLIALYTMNDTDLFDTNEVAVA